MNQPVKTIALVTNPTKDRDYAVFAKILCYLQTLPVSVRVPEDAPACAAPHLPPERLYEGADAAVLIGGDGTILNAARYAIAADCPMLGINLGRLGYMAELEPEEYETIARLVRGDYAIEERMTLKVEAEKDGVRETVYENALNDAVITNAVGTNVIDLLLCCDGAEVLGYRGNGLILSSPTGSTGYGMSAGGPVVDPLMSCMCVVPICALSPAAKPLLFSGDSVMTVENRYERSDFVLLTVDGRKDYQLPYGAKVVCRRAEKNARMIRLKDNKFFSVLRAKINEYGG